MLFSANGDVHTQHGYKIGEEVKMECLNSKNETRK